MVEAKIDLPDDLIRQLQYLKDKLKFQNEAEVIYYAISLLTKIVDAQDKGDQVEIPSSQYPPSGSKTTIKMK